MGRLAFFIESLKNIKSVGTVTRSSRYLCQAVVKEAQLKNTRVIVELGAGDGVMTRHLLKAMPQDAVLFSFEINEVFCQQMSKIKDSRLRIINDSAEKLPDILEAAGFRSVDVIASALPFSVFPEQLTQSIVKMSHQLLKHNGRFVQIHYSLKTRNIYQNIFGNIKTSMEVRNIPPAFVLTCIKKD
ncbi:MAG: methyltransferase [Saprospiraceae bacterium]|nr:methyltransferase [Saprospiraceae bacterium]